MYDYEPYRKLLVDKGIKQQELIDKGVINRNNATSLKHNKAVTTDTIDKICNYFDCDFNEIVRHIKNTSKE